MLNKYRTKIFEFVFLKISKRGNLSLGYNRNSLFKILTFGVQERDRDCDEKKD